MTAHEALHMVRIQLQDNHKNRELFSILEKAVELYDNTDDIQSLEQLFGDVVGDLDKLELTDYGKTYTLEEAKEIVRASKVDTLNKLANAITNFSEEDIDKYWDELFPSKETEDK